MKQRRESIEHFQAAGRDSMVQVEEEESAIIAEFLPQPLSEDELRDLVRAAIAETGASSPADLGKVMGRLAPQTKGRADGKVVSDMVRRSSAAESMFIPRTLAETEEAVGEGPGPAP